MPGERHLWGLLLDPAKEWVRRRGQEASKREWLGSEVGRVEGGAGGCYTCWSGAPSS